MLLNEYTGLWLSPGEGGGADAGGETAKTTPGDGESADAKPGQALEAEKVDRAAYEKLQRDHKRALGELETRKAADAKAAEDALKEQGKWQDLYGKEKAAREELEAKHASEIKRLHIKAELNRHSPHDADLALEALAKTEGFDSLDVKDAEAAITKLKADKPFLFKGDDEAKEVPATQNGQSSLKSKPIDFSKMTDREFQDDARARRNG